VVRHSCGCPPVAPSVASILVIQDLVEKVTPRHGFHDQQGSVRLDGCPQEENNVGVAASLQDEDLLYEIHLTGGGGA
jgi:hypothetical protein